MLETPVLFIIFNRPDTQRQVLERIREVQPKQLFIVADGPRANKPEDVEKCKQARAIIDELVDWNCELFKNYSETNQGCRDRISTGISWFFEHVEEGIILEDDCLPSLGFFPFCESLLSNYREDDSISQISGFNTEGVSNYIINDYFYSALGTIWGWATWKRAWNKMSISNDFLFQIKNEKIIESFFKGDEALIRHRYNILNKLLNREIDSWVYYWTFTKMKYFKYAVVPKFNLTKNIGFSIEATHTKSNDYLSQLAFYDTNQINIFNTKKIINSRFDKINYQRTTNYLRYNKPKFKEKLVSTLKSWINL